MEGAQTTHQREGGKEASLMKGGETAAAGAQKRFMKTNPGTSAGATAAFNVAGIQRHHQVMLLLLRPRPSKLMESLQQ